MEQTKRRRVSFPGLSGPQLVEVQFPRRWDLPEAAANCLRRWNVPHESEGSFIPFWDWVWLGYLLWSTTSRRGRALAYNTSRPFIHVANFLVFRCRGRLLQGLLALHGSSMVLDIALQSHGL